MEREQDARTDNYKKKFGKKDDEKKEDPRSIQISKLEDLNRELTGTLSEIGPFRAFGGMVQTAGFAGLGAVIIGGEIAYDIWRIFWPKVELYDRIESLQQDILTNPVQNKNKAEQTKTTSTSTTTGVCLENAKALAKKTLQSSYNPLDHMVEED